MDFSVVAAYDNFYIANGAVRELIEYGFPRENIRIYTHNRGEPASSLLREYLEVVEDAALVQPAKLPVASAVGARIGASIGSSAGLMVGMLSLMGLLEIPGIMGLPALAAASAAGALSGAAIGEVLGALLGFGISMEEAERYAECLRQSDVVVKIHTEPYSTALVQDVLSRYRPREMDQKAVEPSGGKWDALAQRLQPAYDRIFRR